MCFTISSSEREKLVKRFQRNNGVLYLWKILTRNNDSTYFYHRWKGGWNKCGNGLFSQDGQAKVGLYVYLTRERARLDKADKLSEKIVRVRCHLKDLLFTDGVSATFTKCWVDKKELK
jgi:hypothetical protein